MQNRVILALVVLGVASVGLVAADNDDPCYANGGARNATEVGECVSRIKETTFSDDKIIALHGCVKRDNKGYTGAQVAKLLSLFTFSDDQVKAIGILQPYILGMSCQDAVTVLNVASFSSDKITMLKVLVSASALVDVKANADTIVNSFTFSSDQATARSILKGMVPRSCVYGRITSKRTVFVVDTSGSMAATFSVDGVSYNRLSYVAKELTSVIQDQLTSDKYFDVLRFSSGVQEWKPALQQATASNLQMAVSFINSWTADGGTNIYQALVDAYAFDDVEAVYLLSDGYPSVGTTNTATIIDKAASLSKGRTIPCHTVAFLEGNSGADNPAASERFMSALADATGGVYRLMKQ